MEMNGSSSGSKGFTVLELLITMVVAAIILGWAVPSLVTFSANNQVVTASNSIVTGLNLARSTAVTSGERVAICPSANGSTCSVDWDKGWIVFDDSDEGGVPVEAEMIRVATLSGSLSNSANVQVIVFEADGTTDQSSDLSIELCNTDTGVTDRCQQISISPFGVISSSKTTATI